jgi:hypothetical protein
MERLRIITSSALRVTISNEEILDDLLYPAKRAPARPRRRAESRRWKRR